MSRGFSPEIAHNTITEIKTDRRRRERENNKRRRDSNSNHHGISAAGKLRREYQSKFFLTFHSVRDTLSRGTTVSARLKKANHTPSIVSTDIPLFYCSHFGLVCIFLCTHTHSIPLFWMYMRTHKHTHTHTHSLSLFLCFVSSSSDLNIVSPMKDVFCRF